MNYVHEHVGPKVLVLMPAVVGLHSVIYGFDFWTELNLVKPLIGIFCSIGFL